MNGRESLACSHFREPCLRLDSPRQIQHLALMLERFVRDCRSLETVDVRRKWDVLRYGRQLARVRERNVCIVVQLKVVNVFDFI